jgi:hypothetical protein
VNNGDAPGATAWDLRVEADGEDQAWLIDDDTCWYAYLALVLDELYETVTR